MNVYTKQVANWVFYKARVERSPNVVCVIIDYYLFFSYLPREFATKAGIYLEDTSTYNR